MRILILPYYFHKQRSVNIRSSSYLHPSSCSIVYWLLISTARGMVSRNKHVWGAVILPSKANILQKHYNIRIIFAISSRKNLLDLVSNAGSVVCSFKQTLQIYFDQFIQQHVDDTDLAESIVVICRRMLGRTVQTQLIQRWASTGVAAYFQRHFFLLLY